MNSRLFIIGGGLSGIGQAIKFQHEYREIIIVEGGKSLGGLLKSVCINGKHYPLGTHFLRKTGNEQMDRLLFSELDQWTTFPYLKNGSISYGILKTATGFLDIKNASISTKVDFYLHLIKELIKNDKKRWGQYIALSEYEHIRNRFGARIAENFNQLSYKYYGIDLRQQAQGSLSPLVCTDRIKAFSEGITKYLKGWDYFDARLSFHNSMYGSTKNENFIPKGLNYIEWWSNVEKRLNKDGFKVMTNTKVSRYDEKTLYIEKGKDSQITQDIRLMQDDRIIDTVRVAKGSRVKQAQTILLFFECNKKALVDSYYITSYTRDDPFSRITLCRNIGAEHNGIVIEVVKEIKFKFDEIKITSDIEIALKRYGIIRKSAKINLVKVINLGPNGFQPKYINLGSKELGIAGGNKWFMDEILNG